MLNDPFHPAWKLLRTAVVGTLLVAFLSLNYNKMDERDITTIIGVVSGLLGYDLTKAKMTSQKKEKQDDISELES